METERQQLVVAVVEDDAGVREATESLLNSAGFTVRGYSTAEEFLRSRRGCRAGCVILDVRLPGMSGLELQHRLLKRGSSIPIIFITADEDRGGRLRAQALRSGAVAFLDKPFGDTHLLRAVATALERCSR